MNNEIYFIDLFLELITIIYLICIFTLLIWISIWL